MPSRIGSRILFFLACLALVGSSGCVPTVVWLPDSSGFLFVDNVKAPQIVLFDLATKKKRVVVEGIPPMSQPGLSPDGKTMAVAAYEGFEKSVPGGGSFDVQLAFYNLEGKLLERSKKFTWGKPTQFGDKMPPFVYWSPKGGHLVVAVEGCLGIYDLKAKTMKLVPEALPGVIAGSPIRPDGAGFLAVKDWEDGKKTPPIYVFVDWQGKESNLKMPADWAQIAESLHTSIIVIPSLGATRWDKNVAVVAASGVTMDLDTGKLEARIKKGDPGKSADDLPIRCRYPLADGALVRSVDLPLPKKGIQVVVPPLRLELLLPGQKDAKVLVKSTGLVTATPSPNGQWLAFFCMEGDVNLVVVNRKGEAIEVPLRK